MEPLIKSAMKAVTGILIMNEICDMAVTRFLGDAISSSMVPLS